MKYSKFSKFMTWRHFSITLTGLFFIVVGVRFASFAFQEPNDEVIAAVLQSTGKVVLVGRFTDNHVLRKNSDGTNDDSFSSSWHVGGFNRPVLTAAVQSDDKIVMGGEFTNFDDSLAGYIARLNGDGSLDTVFSAAVGTGFNDQVNVLALQSDGKIIAGGLFTSFNGTEVRHIARLNSDGSLDNTFLPGDGFDAPVLALESQDDGQILVGGSFTSYQRASGAYLLKLQGDGTTSAQFQFKTTN